MGLLRKEYESMNDMIEMLELLLGFEDFTWTNSTVSISPGVANTITFLDGDYIY